LLRRLAERDPVVHHWLLRWPKALEQDLQPLLP
jgi:GTP-binding protein Era